VGPRLNALPRVADGGDGLQMWRITVNICSRGQPTRVSLPACGLGEGLTIPNSKKAYLLRNFTRGLGRILWNGIQ
jgi:hypothetical protein